MTGCGFSRRRKAGRRLGDDGRSLEFRDVRSWREFDAVLGARINFRIILQKPFAHIAGSHPDNGIVGGVVGRRTVEEFDSEIALLEFSKMTVEGILHHELKELLAPAAAFKRGARDYLADMRFERGGVGS